MKFDKHGSDFIFVLQYTPSQYTLYAKFQARTPSTQLGAVLKTRLTTQARLFFLND